MQNVSMILTTCPTDVNVAEVLRGMATPAAREVGHLAAVTIVILW